VGGARTFARTIEETNVRPDKNTETRSNIRDRNFLSLFKGQGAAVRGDDRVVNVRHGKATAEGD